MLRGRFGNTSGRPYLEGRVSLLVTGQHADISFLFDTGADMTLLMPADALRLGVNFNDPKLLRAPLNGVGGAAAGVVLQSVIAFAGNSGNVYVYQTMIFAAEPSPQIKDVPSLLGRNIIDQWEVTYAPKSIGLTAKILSADFTLPTRPQNTGP